MGDQTYDCWYATYSSTHEREGQPVEIVTRAFYDETVGVLKNKIDTALRALDNDKISDEERMNIAWLSLDGSKQ